MLVFCKIAVSVMDKSLLHQLCKVDAKKVLLFLVGALLDIILSCAIFAIKWSSNGLPKAVVLI